MNGLFPDNATPAVLLAGFLGGVTSALLRYEGFWETLRKLLIGFFCAAYFTPLCAPLISLLSSIGLAGESGPALAGFICGLCGLLIIESVVKIVTATLRKADDDNGGDIEEGH